MVPLVDTGQQRVMCGRRRSSARRRWGSSGSLATRSTAPVAVSGDHIGGSAGVDRRIGVGVDAVQELRVKALPGYCVGVNNDIFGHRLISMEASLSFTCVPNKT